MNEIVKNFSLSGAKFMPEMNLKQPGFTFSPCGPFTKNEERIKKFKETGDTNYLYKNEIDKACFQHDMAYGVFKDIARRTASDKVLTLSRLGKGLVGPQAWTFFNNFLMRYRIDLKFFDFS